MERTRIDNIWDNKPALDKLENERNRKRISSKRLTFDCFNVRVRGDEVTCARGKTLGLFPGGSLILISVLRGITPEICKTCELFSTE